MFIYLVVIRIDMQLNALAYVFKNILVIYDQCRRVNVPWNNNCAIDKNLLLHSGYTECLPNFRLTSKVTSLKLCSVTDNYIKFKKRAINKSYNSYRTLASDICLQSISCFWNWLKWVFLFFLFHYLLRFFCFSFNLFWQNVWRKTNCQE